MNSSIKNINKYVKLIRASTPYAERMTRLRNRIFGDVVRKTDLCSMKIVKKMAEEPIYNQDKIINYYPRHRDMFYLTLKLREYGLYRDEYLDFKDETKRTRVARGKIAPQKGKGKQAVNK